MSAYLTGDWSFQNLEKQIFECLWAKKLVVETHRWWKIEILETVRNTIVESMFEKRWKKFFQRFLLKIGSRENSQAD